MAHLKLETSSASGELFDLNTSPITLGRDEHNTFVFDDAQVSRQHARLYSHAGSWYIEDLNSSNGTFVNQARLVSAKPLENGDRLQVGQSVLTFLAASPYLAAAPEPNLQAVTQTPPRGVSSQQPSSSVLSLTSQEQEDLIFQEGDFFEILSGNLSITLKQTGKTAYTSEEVGRVTFLFKSTDPDWQTKEWQIMVNGQVPEGEALLILYRRGDTAETFGVVGMVNGAWVHVTPLLAVGLIADSTKARELKKLEAKSLGSSMVKAMLPRFLGGGVDKAGQSSYKATAQEIEATVRSFMYRIAQDRRQYWTDQSNSTGKL